MSEAEACVCLGRPQHSCSRPMVQSCPPTPGWPWKDQASPGQQVVVNPGS